MAENPTFGPKTNCEMSNSTNGQEKLEWNQKKQDIILNLALTNNTEADQTPTPTRFILNCEEVGLFQDLQNVNPFDEVFKKAVENPASGTAHVPVTSTDDTLHTPQIYPHLEQGTCETVSANPNYNLNTIISSLDKDSHIEGDGSQVVYVEKEIEISKCNIEKNNEKASSAVLSSNKQVIRKNANIEKSSANATTNQNSTKHRHLNREDILRQREANKAAQSRCRKKKQQTFEQMQLEIDRLRKENLRLSNLNWRLEERVKKLEIQLKGGTQPSEDNQESKTPTAIISPTKKMKSIKPKGPVMPSGTTVLFSVPLQGSPMQSPENAMQIVIVSPNSMQSQNEGLAPTNSIILPFNKQSVTDLIKTKLKKA